MIANVLFDLTRNHLEVAKAVAEAEWSAASEAYAQYDGDSVSETMELAYEAGRREGAYVALMELSAAIHEIQAKIAETVASLYGASASAGADSVTRPELRAV